MNYSQEIRDAYKVWMEAEAKVPEYEYKKGYKSRKAKAWKLWKDFDAKCTQAGYKAVQVSMDIMKENDGGKLSLTDKS